tara:strand:+ start:4201 stop:4611 length:411 start_codon:yes stop_codon:yes gene_type:complete
MTSFILFLLIATPAAYADDPEFATLKQGDVAPFSGRLLNDAAIAKIIVDKKFEGKECELRVSYEVDLMKTREKYKYDILSATCEADDVRLNELISIRDEENKYLREQIKPNRSGWWLAGGFVTGMLTAVGIVNLVK